jgi:Cd2+/Zn2+-exporting ATPase
MGTTCCDTKGPEPDRLRLQTLSTLTALVGVLLAWILPRLGFPGAVVPALAVSFVAGGWSAAIGAWAELRRGKLDVDALMLVAALGAASVGHGLEGGILLFLF